MKVQGDCDKLLQPCANYLQTEFTITYQGGPAACPIAQQVDTDVSSITIDTSNCNRQETLCGTGIMTFEARRSVPAAGGAALAPCPEAGPQPRARHPAEGAGDAARTVHRPFFGRGFPFRHTAGRIGRQACPGGRVHDTPRVFAHRMIRPAPGQATRSRGPSGRTSTSPAAPGLIPGPGLHDKPFFTGATPS